MKKKGKAIEWHKRERKRKNRKEFFDISENDFEGKEYKHLNEIIRWH